MPALKKGTPLVDWTKAAPGRPKSNLGAYIVKPVGPNRSKTGFEMLEKTPQAIKAAKEAYLKAYELPPSLAPQYIREPEVQARQRAKSISKGWLKPRSRQE
jgi:hypothetical protein